MAASDPFYMRDLELRAPGVTFNMTPEEMEEYQKCYDDALYFVRNYCKFQTDNGMNLVDLRDFQEKIIKIVNKPQLVIDPFMIVDNPLMDVARIGDELVEYDNGQWEIVRNSTNN